MDLDESADMVNVTHLFYCDEWRHSERTLEEGQEMKFLAW